MKMMNQPLELDLLPKELSIVQLSPDASIPSWALSGSWFSITRTQDECSIVCESNLIPDEGVRQVGPWGVFKVRGPLDFGMTGILWRIANPLSSAGISIFAMSTYDTDYMLVRKDLIKRAASNLKQAGIIVHTPGCRRNRC